MVKSCVAYNCKNRFEKGLQLTFHKFPFSRPDLLKKWEYALKRKDFHATKYMFLCSDHFTPESFLKNYNNRKILKDDAVPTIFNFPPHLQRKERTRRTETTKRAVSSSTVGADASRPTTTTTTAPTSSSAETSGQLQEHTPQKKTVETPAAETPAPGRSRTTGVTIKSESVTSEDESYHSEFLQSDATDDLKSQIEISDTQIVEPIASQSTMFDEIPGPSEPNIRGKRKAAETITSDSKCSKVTDIDSALQKLEEICDKAINITPQSEDSFDHFGKYVASLLRTVPTRTAFQLQEQIIGLIMSTQMDST